jgi:hypothetical protein
MDNVYVDVNNNVYPLTIDTIPVPYSGSANPFQRTKKFIVTTTIYEPSEAVKKFSQMFDWKLIVVGDLKTPHKSYDDVNCIYMSPEYQQENYPEVSEAIGWNKIMRRNLGFLEAYKLGADIIASVDDDNIPHNNWGKFIRVGETITVDSYSNSSSLVFDPMQMTNHSELWHRGFPLVHILDSKNISYDGQVTEKILVQADLWDGDPDIDAICRMQYNPYGLKLEIANPFISSQLVPFNSQNTFFAREVIPYYMCLPYVGRMDDIWGGYLLQYLYPNTPLFSYATTYQDRNLQSVYKNFEAEVLGYMRTKELLDDLSKWKDIFPKETVKAFEAYQNEYAKLGAYKE